jgi:hypothetical protein
MMGSTAISRSLRLSHSTTLASGAGFVASLSTFASTR